MDLREIRVSEEAMPMELLDADDNVMQDENGNPVVIYVYSTDGPAYKKVDREIARKNLEKLGRKKTLKLNKLLESTSPEDSERDHNKRVAACIAGWKNIIEDGKPLPYSDKNALRLVSEYSLIKEQVEDFATDRANFTKSLSTNSSSSANPTLNSNSPELETEASLST